MDETDLMLVLIYMIYMRTCVQGFTPDIPLMPCFTSFLDRTVLIAQLVPAAAPMSIPFKGPSLLTRSSPKLLPQTTGPEPAE